MAEYTEGGAVKPHDDLAPLRGVIVSSYLGNENPMQTEDTLLDDLTIAVELLERWWRYQVRRNRDGQGAPYPLFDEHKAFREYIDGRLTSETPKEGRET